MQAAFAKLLALNRTFTNIEITANFLIGAPLSQKHHERIADLLSSVEPIRPPKGAVYLSPYAGQPDGTALLETFFEIKRTSRLPVFVYLIQRL